MTKGRVRVPKLPGGSDSEESDQSVQTPKKKRKKREEPSRALLDLLASKKKQLKKKDQRNSQLSAAEEQVARLTSTVKEQRVELKELRALNRQLQQKLLDALDCRQGKHCPRFPDCPRKAPLSPWKVSVIRECYKERLEKKGLVAELMPGALKQMNRFIVEKLSDIERMSKRAAKELP
ncbi:hypothetical protein HPB52_025302 [Rhipicephalus sanguineus]|uniref:Uncharacterized protein n=1 Tax=Rhipicephalus sanguineus TaxID=34632 RepID=A0A9D4TD80_RHISA|nr:hypothetical protein HPB52_025302 [Rhipicephalus sanguineus]